ncbi:MAG: hypothetical protein AB7S26_24905 [Sandaracinaceae bacterium]
MRRTTVTMASRLGVACAVLVALATTSTPAAAQDDVPAPSVSPERIRAALQRYRHEPSVRRVVSDALEARSGSPGRLRDAMDRARATGWLPTARASIRRGQAVDLRGLANGEPSSIATGDDLSFDATLVFRFDRIVFASEETTLLHELRATEEAAAELAALVIHLYFERRRLQLEQDLLRRIDVERALRILEVEALLDELTGGRFSDAVRPG